MSTIFVNVQGFSSIGKEIVFLAKEKSKEKVVTDLMQRYANVINENIKGKTLKEKKLWYRKNISINILIMEQHKSRDYS